MQSNQVLDCSNHEHLHALHYVYTLHINKSLEIFKSEWNCHPIRTERNLCPTQLWVIGMLQNFGSAHMAVNELFSPALNEFS